MYLLLLGFKSFRANALPEMVYCGTCGDEAEKAIAKSSGFVRIGKLISPPLVPVQIPEEKLAKALEDLSAREEKAAGEERQALQRQAELDAKAKADEAEKAALAAVEKARVAKAEADQFVEEAKQRRAEIEANQKTAVEEADKRSGAKKRGS